MRAHAQTQKISISLEQPLYKFIEGYQTKHHYKNRSEVIAKAVRLLQQQQLRKLLQRS